MKSNMLNKTLLFSFLLFCSQFSFAQKFTVAENEKPEMIVISANYGLLIGYSFFIEYRGAKRTGRKEIYKSLEDEIIQMGNPSDAMIFMNNSGYDLLEVYSFPKGVDTVTINYVFKKRN